MNTSDSVDDIVIEIIHKIKEAFPDFKGAYLFGLFSDGQMHEEEDMELAAIFENIPSKTERETIWRLVGETEEMFDVYIDLHPLTISELQHDKEFCDEILKTGIYFNADLFF